MIALNMRLFSLVLSYAGLYLFIAPAVENKKSWKLLLILWICISFLYFLYNHIKMVEILEKAVFKAGL